MQIIHGDSFEELEWLDENHFASVVTDPPYELTSIVKRFGKKGSAPAKFGQDGRYSRLSKGFMGHEWDGSGIQRNPEFWAKVLKVMKPGAFMLAFGGTRTFYRTACAIEDAGFIIFDTICWLYGQGFPKSHDISKAIDARVGVERPIIGKYQLPNGQEWNLKQAEDDTVPAAPGTFTASGRRTLDVTGPVSEQAKEWDGWGTALKPAFEPIILAQRPISEKTIVDNVLKWGTGGINIDESRIALNGEVIPINVLENWSGFGQEVRPDYTPTVNTKGRWPANVILDEDAGQMVDEQSGISKSSGGSGEKSMGALGKNLYGKYALDRHAEHAGGLGDIGGASRFFYCAKASKSEKTNGGKAHPTSKPIALMVYLVRLITPKGGIVLDPFLGGGTTALACMELGYDCVGIEKEQEYYELAMNRIKDANHS